MPKFLEDQLRAAVKKAGKTLGGSIGNTAITLTSVNFVDAETPVVMYRSISLPDGLMRYASLMLANTPNPTASLILARNGGILTQGQDYTISGNVVAFLGYLSYSVTASDKFLAWYRA